MTRPSEAEQAKLCGWQNDRKHPDGHGEPKAGAGTGGWLWCAGGHLINDLTRSLLVVVVVVVGRWLLSLLLVVMFVAGHRCCWL